MMLVIMFISALYLIYVYCDNLLMNFMVTDYYVKEVRTSHVVFIYYIVLLIKKLIIIIYYYYL